VYSTAPSSRHPGPHVCAGAPAVQPPALRDLWDLIPLLPPRAMAHTLALLRHLARDVAFGDVLQQAEGYTSPLCPSSPTSPTFGVRAAGHELRSQRWRGAGRGGQWEAARLANHVHAHALLLLLALCKDSKRRQEAVLEAGGVPLLMALAAGGRGPVCHRRQGERGGVPGASPLQHLAIPLLCDLAQGSPRARAQVAALGVPQLFLSLLAPPTVRRRSPLPPPLAGRWMARRTRSPVAPAAALSYEHSPLAYCLPQVRSLGPVHAQVHSPLAYCPSGAPPIKLGYTIGALPACVLPPTGALATSALQ